MQTERYRGGSNSMFNRRSLSFCTRCRREFEYIAANRRTVRFFLRKVAINMRREATLLCHGCRCLNYFRIWRRGRQTNQNVFFVVYILLSHSVSPYLLRFLFPVLYHIFWIKSTWNDFYNRLRHRSIPDFLYQRLQLRLFYGDQMLKHLRKAL